MAGGPTLCPYYRARLSPDANVILTQCVQPLPIAAPFLAPFRPIVARCAWYVHCWYSGPQIHAATASGVRHRVPALHSRRARERTIGCEVAGRIRDQGRAERALERSAVPLAEGGPDRSDVCGRLEQSGDCVRTRGAFRGSEPVVRKGAATRPEKSPHSSELRPFQRN